MWEKKLDYSKFNILRLEFLELIIEIPGKSTML